MKKEYIILGVLVILIVSLMIAKDSIKGFVKNFRIRPTDKAGSGKFGATRRTSTGKEYTHAGLDILSEPNDPVFAPFDMKFVRKAYPYADKSYNGGLYESKDFEIKIFYFDPNIKPFAKKGDILGYTEDIQIKYPDATPHIHLEMRNKATGELLNPENYI